MKSLTGLWSCLALDCASRCSTSAIRDIETVSDRVKHEGESFLTISLPDLGSAFEAALEKGAFDPSLAPGFRCKGSLPLLLGGFFDQVFDRRTGMLLLHPSIDAITCIRQLTLFLKKVEFPTTERRNRMAEKKYLRTEGDLEVVDQSLSVQQRADFSLNFRILYSSVLSRLTKAIENFEIEMFHGPGSVADSLVGNEKFSSISWTQRLEPIFPFALHCRTKWIDSRPKNFFSPAFEPPVKVVFVPKTQRSPRVIAMEPTHMQYVQQGIMRSLIPLLEGCEVGRSQGFSDQEPNRALARQGSIDQKTATIDLSEASDRVLNSLVSGAMSPWRTVHDAIQACRSTDSILPSGNRITLRKFASMGSALCFPIEVMVFSTIVLMGLQKAGRTLEDSVQLMSSGQVRIYGDDIIVPVDSAYAVEELLETYGLVVNRQKSFSKGLFRESCGGDYFLGAWVTPIRLRKPLPSSARHASQLVSVSSTANQLWMNGFERASEYLHTLCKKILRIYPKVPPNSDLIGRWSFDWRPTRWNTRLFRGEINGFIIHSPLARSALSLPGFLYKTLRWRWDDPLHKDHAEHAGRSLSCVLRRVWRVAE